MKGSFRIICLKNDDSRKYRDERIKNSNIVASAYNGKDKKGSESLIPNIVHLSARIQDDSNQQKRPQSQGYLQFSNRSNQPNSLSIGDFENISNKQAQEVKQMRQLQIERFFEEKQMNIQRQKNTMKNLLGSINFSANKHKEKRISRLIRDACTTQRSKKQLNLSQMSILPQNKPQLQQDFQNFIVNKAKATQTHTQNFEDVKLKRLSKVNPEQEVAQFVRQSSIRPLNLFHFLNKDSKEKYLDFKQRSRNQSSSNVKPSSLYIQARIDKKIFNFQSSLKTEQQQFQWSKLKDKGHKSKNFTLRTLDL